MAEQSDVVVPPSGEGLTGLGDSILSRWTPRSVRRVSLLLLTVLGVERSVQVLRVLPNCVTVVIPGARSWRSAPTSKTLPGPYDDAALTL